MKLIMENWRRYTNEQTTAAGTVNEFYSQRFEDPDLNSKLPKPTADQIRNLISLVDPTQISAYPDIPPAIKAWEGNPSWGNSALLVLALTAAIPVVGKAAKLASKFTKFTKALKKVKGGAPQAAKIKNNIAKVAQKTATNVSKFAPFDRKAAFSALVYRMSGGNAKYIKDILERLKNKIRYLSPEQRIAADLANLMITNASTFASKIEKYGRRGVVMQKPDLIKANLFFKEAFGGRYQTLTTKDLEELITHISRFTT